MDKTKHHFIWPLKDGDVEFISPKRKHKIYGKLLLEGDVLIVLIPNPVFFFRFFALQNVSKMWPLEERFLYDNEKIPGFSGTFTTIKKTHQKSFRLFSHLVQLQLGFFVFQVAELAILSLVAIAIEKADAKASADLPVVFLLASPPVTSKLLWMQKCK